MRFRRTFTFERSNQQQSVRVRQAYRGTLKFQRRTAVSRWGMPHHFTGYDGEHLRNSEMQHCMRRFFLHNQNLKRSHVAAARDAISPRLPSSTSICYQDTKSNSLADDLVSRYQRATGCRRKLYSARKTVRAVKEKRRREFFRRTNRKSNERKKKRNKDKLATTTALQRRKRMRIRERN